METSAYARSLAIILLRGMTGFAFPDIRKSSISARGKYDARCTFGDVDFSRKAPSRSVVPEICQCSVYVSMLGCVTQVSPGFWVGL